MSHSFSRKKVVNCLLRIEVEIENAGHRSIYDRSIRFDTFMNGDHHLHHHHHQIVRLVK